MGLTFITGYVLGQKDAARNRAAAVAMSDTNPDERAAALQERVDRLVLIVEAMWTLLADKGYSEVALIDRIRELDHSDGDPDGRIRREALYCSNCDSATPPGKTHCQFCGAEFGDGGAFSGV